MKNKETLELFKIYLNQTFKKNENQRSIHDDGHDNSGGHPDYHNDSHDNVTSELRINLVKHETNKHFG